jgi:hypothetical protein
MAPKSTIQPFKKIEGGSAVSVLSKIVVLAFSKILGWDLSTFSGY